MGGGDLNLKKSWHPSTMKNMEKVWKAEQEKNQEKKRIAELKREIAMERDREDMTKYAMEQGVIEKKDDKKLDWMYKGPNDMVTREDYLLGRPIDKSFEKVAQTQKDADLNRAPKNHVEYECIPPSLRFFSGNEQVDLARKMQEDPLYAIKKKETETRSQLLKNPVKLKKLKELLEQQTKKKSKKKKSSNSTDNSDDETELDNLLAAKYKKLKDRISEKDLIKSMKRIKHKKRKKSRKVSSDSDSEIDSDGESDNSDDSSSNSSSANELVKRKKKKRNHKKRSSSNDSGTMYRKKKNKKDNEKKEKHKKSGLCKSDEEDTKKLLSKSSNTHYLKSDRIPKRERNHPYRRNATHRDDDNYRDNESNKRYKESSFVEKSYNENHRNSYHSSFNVPQKRFNEDKRNEQKWVSKKILSEEEKEKRRLEMMENASWRNKERERNVKQYQEQEKKELSNEKAYNKDFIRKQLVAAAEVGTVASRIKSNINNIQRSCRAMDTNFAKR
ncbi:hypothetical protein M0802_004904 [Mischocyttarus mexicanus]|nr:hypothetical protein M0802_004904 [Mischocyttarus mexicanus]